MYFSYIILENFYYIIVFHKIRTSFSYLYNKLLAKFHFAHGVIILISLAIMFSIFTYSIISDDIGSLQNDSNPSGYILGIDLALLCFLLIVFVWRFTRMWLNRKFGVSGEMLQSKVVLMFAIVAVIPTIIISLFSTLFFNYGIQSWFNDRVKTVLDESLTVAEIYLREHTNNIIGDILAMLNDVNNHVKNGVEYWKGGLNDSLSTQIIIRDLSDAIVFSGNTIMSHSNNSNNFNLSTIPSWAKEKARNKEVIVLYDKKQHKVFALVKLRFLNAFLIVGRIIDNRVLYHVDTSRSAVNSYRSLENNISSLQIQFSIMFFVISSLLVLASMWAGVIFSGNIVRAICNLVDGTKKVADGDFSVRVKPEVGASKDEVTTLTVAFNQMTEKLENQHLELKNTNTILNERRVFIETVLAGLLSGVIVLDHMRNIKLYNNCASKIFQLDKNSIGSGILNCALELNEILDECINRNVNLLRKQIVINRNRKIITLIVSVIKIEHTHNDWVITFDDISELVSAQKFAAWVDVARRIAHEIKNPITPIYLASERLMEKYSNAFEGEDKAAFTRYLNTIIKHTDTINYVVTEFVNFSRMPAPNFCKVNITEILNNSIFSNQIANSDVIYNIDIVDGAKYIMGDENHLSRLYENILKNACEAMFHRKVKDKCINVILLEENDNIKITIFDNGGGIPSELINRITEPYVTTNPNGVGLGLAIVKKIVLEHNGIMNIYNSDIGAVISTSFPIFTN